MFMKITRLVLLAVMGVMLAFTSAQAGFYAGFQVGPNFPMSSGAHVNIFNQTVDTGNLAFATGFMIGVQAGYDFLSDTANFPPWAQYFTVAVDYQYNSYNINRQNFSVRIGNLIAQGDIPSANLPGHCQGAPDDERTIPEGPVVPLYRRRSQHCLDGH
jgi:hypothetical protein